MVTFVEFPDLSNSNQDGLLAMGGDLSTDTLVSAYSQGIFPWFNDDQPVLWWSPDPRLVLHPERVKIKRSLVKTIRRKQFHVTCDEAFKAVLTGCAQRGLRDRFPAPAETWITSEMHQAYIELHQQGYAHSVEVWQAEELVGGLYGVVLGDVFFGESMFSDVSDASKVALVALCQSLQAKGFALIDCQVETDHLISMGAENVARDEFVTALENIDIQQNSSNFADSFLQATA